MLKNKFPLQNHLNATDPGEIGWKEAHSFLRRESRALGMVVGGRHGLGFHPTVESPGQKRP